MWPSPNWGMKRTCQSCGTRFYDLLAARSSARNAARSTIPRRCSSRAVAERRRRGRRPRRFGPEAVPKRSPRSRSPKRNWWPRARRAKRRRKLIEDTSELGEDEDDMAEVIENVEEEER